MTDEKRQQEGRVTNRRNVLKSLGASAIVAGGVPVIGSASPSFREKIERAIRIREKTGRHENFVKYLRKNDVIVDTNEYQYRVPLEGNSTDGGVSTESLDDANLSVNVTLTYEYSSCYDSSPTIYTDYYWDWNNVDGYGETGGDVVSLSWPETHWYYDSQYSGNRVTHYDRSGHGSVWKFDDSFLSSGDSFSTYAGCYISEGSGVTSTSRIYGKYRHTYQTYDICSVTYNSDGTTAVTFCSSTDKWISGYDNIEKSNRDTVRHC